MFQSAVMSKSVIETTAIECLDIEKSYKGRRGEPDRIVLQDASFTATEGEFVCILGPSGCGKSTFLNILSGLDRNFSGTARVRGIDVEDPNIASVRSAYIFQESRLLPWRTVQGNLEFTLKAAGYPQSEWQERVDRYLGMVGLLEFKDFYPNELSGGMQQRTSIARAFSIEPDVLYMDEPFSALDELSARRLRAELLEIWSQHKTTVVFVTHNSFEATFLADRILIMKRGPQSSFADEIDLGHLERPRSSESADIFEASRVVVQRLVTVIGDTPD
ncbi:ABC transporter ATP-binding protein [Salinibacterium hongtaonis]|uniref:ABC transporter ATP-binding protein n=1 Tax=Homoserinimonas hongtaonis TaxID=2079791 RepID=UPI000D3B6DCE|nr:ABC transporter ATP-binding protein [Salinibacterium hongtaonis]AWB90053.1 ABC transporter ATP-binding protein [Salinibacterium hongtaonis]